MKKITWMLFILLTAQISKSQDIIVTKDSLKTKAVILEINSTEIKYKLFDYSDGPKYVINKDRVSYILFKNGTIEKYIETVPVTKNTQSYNPNKYNYDKIPVVEQDPQIKIKKCEKLYNKKNYLGFNYITFLNTCLGFNYMRDIKKANLIINVPFAFGVGSPAITNSLYNRSHLDNTSTTKYDLMKYQIGINVLFAASMNREVNFLMGPAFNLSEYRVSVNTRYTTLNAGQYQYNNGVYKNRFNLHREHYGMNIGFLARFSEKINMNMLVTFGYKKDTYNQQDPYGIETINADSKHQVALPDNVMPYVNFAWSIGYRF
jgi:hypothetical protein